MSMFKRIQDIFRSRKELPEIPKVNPFEDSRVGDIVSVDLEQYVVTGKVVYFDRGYPPHRFAYYIRNGSTVSCLLVEKGRTYECFLCDFVEGSLDDPANVPTRLDLDGETHYDLENHRSDVTRTEGQTDFRSGDELLLWRYYSRNERYFFLQWQDGKFVAMEGSRLPLADVNFMRSTGSNR